MQATLIGVWEIVSGGVDHLRQVHCEQMAGERCNLDDARKVGHVRGITWSLLVTAAYNGDEIRTELFCKHCFGDIG